MWEGENGADSDQSSVDVNKTYGLVDSTSEITRLSKRRDILKRRITTTLGKLYSIFETEGQSVKHGVKTRIMGYVSSALDYLCQAEKLNDQILILVHEDKQEEVLMWYEEQLEKVNEAKLRAEIYFDEQKRTSPSPPGSVAGSHVLTSKLNSKFLKN